MNISLAKATSEIIKFLWSSPYVYNGIDVLYDVLLQLKDMSFPIVNQTLNISMFEINSTLVELESFCSEVNLTITPKAETLTGPQNNWIGILPHREYNCNLN